MSLSAERFPPCVSDVRLERIGCDDLAGFGSGARCGTPGLDMSQLLPTTATSIYRAAHLRVLLLAASRDSRLHSCSENPTGRTAAQQQDRANNEQRRVPPVSIPRR